MVFIIGKDVAARVGATKAGVEPQGARLRYPMDERYVWEWRGGLFSHTQPLAPDIKREKRRFGIRSLAVPPCLASAYSCSKSAGGMRGGSGPLRGGTGQ